MAIKCCLAGIDRDAAPTFDAALKAAGASARSTRARLDVRELGKIRPDLLVCDIDALDVDPLEFLRRVRFVLPQCTIAVFSGSAESGWAVQCHLAGANCLLSKNSDARSISSGLRSALRIGCYTDPLFGDGSSGAQSPSVMKGFDLPGLTTGR